MKRLSLILLTICTLLFFSSSATDPSFDKYNKTCKGISLDGGVKFVSHDATFKVYVTTSQSSADIEVLLNRDGLSSSCANWRIVESCNPNFTVQFVDDISDADFSIWFRDY